MSENKKGNPSQDVKDRKDLLLPSKKSVEGRKPKIEPPPPPPKKPVGQENTPQTPANRKG